MKYKWDDQWGVIDTETERHDQIVQLVTVDTKIQRKRIGKIITDMLNRYLDEYDMMTGKRK